MSSWHHLNSIHSMWFLVAAIVTCHFVALVVDFVVVVHQTTIPNLMKIQHVLCIPLSDDYQLEKEEKKIVKFNSLYFKMLSKFLSLKILEGRTSFCVVGF